MRFGGCIVVGGVKGWSKAHNIYNWTLNFCATKDREWGMFRSSAEAGMRLLGVARERE